METTIINTAFHEVCQKAKAKADELRQAKTNKELFEVLTPILDQHDGRRHHCLQKGPGDVHPLRSVHSNQQPVG